MSVRRTLCTAILLSCICSAYANVNPVAQQASEMKEAYQLIALKKDSRAIALLKKIIQKDPANKTAHLELGYAYLRQKKIHKAVEKFEQALRLDSGDHFTALQLGYLYTRLGKKNEAREAFTSAQASPDSKIQESAQTALAALEPAGNP